MARYDVDAVIHIDLPDALVEARILARRTCNLCQRDYNLLDHPPRVPDRCDVCPGTLVMREDDNAEAIRKRLAAYRGETEPLLRLFEQKERVVRIDGTPPANDVQQELRLKLGLS